MASIPPTEVPAQPTQPAQPVTPPPEVAPLTPDLDQPAPGMPGNDPSPGQPSD